MGTSFASRRVISRSSSSLSATLVESLSTCAMCFLISRAAVDRATADASPSSPPSIAVGSMTNSLNNSSTSKPSPANPLSQYASNASNTSSHAPASSSLFPSASNTLASDASSSTESTRSSPPLGATTSFARLVRVSLARPRAFGIDRSLARFARAFARSRPRSPPVRRDASSLALSSRFLARARHSRRRRRGDARRRDVAALENARENAPS